MNNIWQIITAIGTCVTSIIVLIIATLIGKYQNRRKVLIVFSPIMNTNCPTCNNQKLPAVQLDTGFSPIVRVSILNLGSKYIVINGIDIMGGYSKPMFLSRHGTTDKGEGFPICVEPGGIISIQFATEKLRTFIPQSGDQQFSAAMLIKACVSIQDWKKTYKKTEDLGFDLAERLVEWINNNPPEPDF
jgi:hypothetical protein